MSLLTFALLVIIITALVLWAIYYLPLPPSPPHIKDLLMLVVVGLAILLIIARASGHAIL